MQAEQTAPTTIDVPCEEVSVRACALTCFEGSFGRTDAIVVVRIELDDVRMTLSEAPCNFYHVVRNSLAHVYTAHEYPCDISNMAYNWTLTTGQQDLVERSKDTGVFVFSTSTGELLASVTSAVLDQLAHTQRALWRSYKAHNEAVHKKRDARQAEEEAAQQARNAIKVVQQVAKEAELLALREAVSQAEARAAEAEEAAKAMSSKMTTLRAALNDAFKLGGMAAPFAVCS